VLKIDAAPVLERLPQGQVPRLVSDADGINATFKDPQDKRPLSWRLPALPRGASLAVLALLVAAALVYFLPMGMLEVELSKTGVPSTVSEPAPLAAQAPDVQEQAVEAAPAEPPAPPLGVAPPAAAVPPVAAPASAAAEGEAGAGGLLEFKASAESWVQVRDASGSVVFERVLKAGQTAQADGKPPLAVVVGKASATEVLVRGAPFDLAAVARDNVARFEVK
jgi:cytoskeleton protein RodZ